MSTNPAQQAASENSELHIRQAILYDNLAARQDMLTVRILPEMSGLSADLLPNYAYFNPSQVIKGVSEKQSRDVNAATKLWVVCTSDFCTGWVVCEANNQYDTTDTESEDAWGFAKFKEHLLRCRLDTNSADYSELKVLFNNSKTVNLYNEAGIKKNDSRSTAISLDIINVRTGERFMLLQSGTMFALTQDQIYFRVGSPDDTNSFIRIQAGSIEMTSDNIILYGRQKTSLGKHGFQLCGMLGAATALDGSPLVPLLDITC